jgi:hypothetical protein
MRGGKTPSGKTAKVLGRAIAVDFLSIAAVVDVAFEKM